LIRLKRPQKRACRWTFGNTWRHEIYGFHILLRHGRETTPSPGILKRQLCPDFLNHERILNLTLEARQGEDGEGKIDMVFPEFNKKKKVGRAHLIDFFRSKLMVGSAHPTKLNPFFFQTNSGLLYQEDKDTYPPYVAPLCLFS